jgi:hypothetical protein
VIAFASPDATEEVPDDEDAVGLVDVVRRGLDRSGDRVGDRQPPDG